MKRECIFYWIKYDSPDGQYRCDFERMVELNLMRKCIEFITVSFIDVESDGSYNEIYDIPIAKTR